MEKKYAIMGGVVAAIVVIGGIFLYTSPETTAPVITPSPTAQNEVLQQTGDANRKVLAVSSESKVTYQLGEELRGTPTQVIGSTNAVTGSVAVTTGPQGKLEIGQINIDAKTFKTDIAMRDENVRKLVLKTGTAGNEFITFKTTGITGVPSTIETNQDMAITVNGDLTVAGITKQATFTGTAKVTDANAFTLNASTMLTYGDFGVTIPDFSFLANVDKTVTLTVNLVAK